MVFKAASLSAGLFGLYLLTLGIACSTSNSSDATGGASQNAGGAPTSGCHAERALFVDALQAESACESDDECGFYQAPCLGVESGNCAGIFYVNASSVDAIDVLRSDYESCRGDACGGGGVCGLGPRLPKCIDQKCQ